MADVINYRFRVRRGLAATWSGTNPVPLDGELSWERDTGRFKIGDGASEFNTLLYHGIGGVDLTGLADGFVLKWDAANGKWIVAAESGGGGGGGDPYITATAAENLPAMTPVHIGASGVSVADATSSEPAHGYVRTAVSSGNPADVYASGILTTTGLTAGDTYYLRAAGALGAAMLGVGEIRQPLGVAISTTELAVSIGAPITRVS